MARDDGMTPGQRFRAWVLDPASLDAVGIAVPGLVHEGVASLDSRGVPAYDLKDHMEAAYGIPVFADNDTNAAVTGCYVMQDAYDSVMFLRLNRRFLALRARGKHGSVAAAAVARELAGFVWAIGSEAQALAARGTAA